VAVRAPAPERAVVAGGTGVGEAGGHASPACRRAGDLLGQAGVRARAVAQFAAGAAVVTPAPERVALADAAGEVPARGDMDPSRWWRRGGSGGRARGHGGRSGQDGGQQARKPAPAAAAARFLLVHSCTHIPSRGLLNGLIRIRKQPFTRPPKLAESAA